MASTLKAMSTRTEFKINPKTDRDAMVIALAHAGYKVTVEVRPRPDGWSTDKDYYIIVEGT
jgi:hypothetical protein